MRVQANGIEIDYVIEGEGPVVTMCHALGTNLPVNRALLGFLDKVTGRSAL